MRQSTRLHSTQLRSKLSRPNSSRSLQSKSGQPAASLGLRLGSGKQEAVHGHTRNNGRTGRLCSQGGTVHREAVHREVSVHMDQVSTPPHVGPTPPLAASLPIQLHSHPKVQGPGSRYLRVDIALPHGEGDSTNAHLRSELGLGVWGQGWGQACACCLCVRSYVRMYACSMYACMLTSPPPPEMTAVMMARPPTSCSSTWAPIEAPRCSLWT